MRTRLNLESLEAREVPALYFVGSGAGTFKDTNEVVGGLLVNLATESGGSMHPPDTTVLGNETIILDNGGTADCQLGQQNYGGIVVLNNYTGRTRSFSSGLVLNGSSVSSFNGLANAKAKLDLQGDLTISANTCTFDNVDVTWGSPHNIIVSGGATLTLHGTVDSNHNVVNYGTLTFGGSGYSGSTYNITNNNSDTLYIYNGPNGTFNWQGAQAGNASSPNLFYVQNKGTFTFNLPTGATATATLKGAYFNDYGATQLQVGFLVIDGKASKAGFDNKSVTCSHGTWDQDDKASVKYKYDSIWNYTTFDLHHVSGGDYTVTLTAYAATATETKFSHSDVDLRGGAGRGMTLEVAGNLNALVFRDSCNVYETLWYDTNTADCVTSGYTFDAAGPTATGSTLIVSENGTRINGLWNLAVSQSTYTAFWFYTFPLPFPNGLHMTGAVPNGWAVERVGSGGD